MRTTFLATLGAALSIAVIANGAPAPAPGDGGVCKQLTDEIERSQKNIAANSTDGSRYEKQESELMPEFAQIQANIALMTANHCAPYSHPISSYRYLMPAVHCGAGEQDSEACNREKWQPSERPAS